MTCMCYSKAMNFREIGSGKRIMKKRIIASVAAGMFLLAGCASKDVASTKAGKIKYDDFVEEMKNQPQQNGMKLGEQILQRMILEDAFEHTYGDKVSKKAVDKEYKATAKSFDSEEQFKDLLAKQGLKEADVKKNIRTSMLMKEAVKANTKLDDKALKEYYDAQKPVAKVQHILVEDEETANEVIAKLNDGAEFKDLVKEYSKDPGSKDNEGIYVLNEGQMAPEFEEASLDLEEGETTQTPVQTKNGFHVIRRMEFDKEKEFKNSKEDLKEELIKSKLQDPTFMKKVISKMLKDMNVKINDKDLQGAIAPYVEEPKKEDKKDKKDNKDTKENKKDQKDDKKSDKKSE